MQPDPHPHIRTGLHHYKANTMHTTLALRLHRTIPLLLTIGALAGCSDLMSGAGTGSNIGSGSDSNISEATGAPEAVFRQTAAGARACMKFAPWRVESAFAADSKTGSLRFFSTGSGTPQLLAEAKLYEKSAGLTAIDTSQLRAAAGQAAPFPFATALPRWAFGDTSYCPIRG